MTNHKETLYEAGKKLKREGVSVEDADHQLYHWDISFMEPFTEEEKACFWMGYDEVKGEK